MLSASGMLVVRRLLVAALGWAGTLIIIRELPAEAWGGYSLVFSLLGLIGLISDFRMGRIILGALVDDREDAGAHLASYIVLRVLIGVAAYVLAIAIVVLSGYDADVVHATAIAGLAVVVASGGAAFELALRANLWFRDITIASVAAQVVQLLLIVGIVVGGRGTLVLFTVPAVAFEVVEIAWMAHRVRHLVRWEVRPHLWWAWLKEAAPLAAGAALETIYFRIDSVMLAELDDLTAVGVYGIGYKFSDLAGAVPGAVMAPLLTVLVVAWPGNRERFSAAFRQAFVLLLVAGTGIAIGFAAFARPAIGLLYGERYELASGAARALVVGQVLNFFTLLCFSTLVAVGRNRLYPLAALLGVGINVGLNLVLIPRYSYNGAATATIVTEVVVLLVLAAGTFRTGATGPIPWPAIGRTAVAGAVMTVTAVAVVGRLPWIAGGLLVGAAYLATLHVLAVDGPGGLRALARRFDADP